MTAWFERTTGYACWPTVEHTLADLPEHDRQTMQRHVLNSRWCWIGYSTDQIHFFLGVIPPTLLADRVYLWLYILPAPIPHTLTFIRGSRRVITEILDIYPLIVGHCHCENQKGQRWLQWLGARFKPSADLLLPFEITR